MNDPDLLPDQHDEHPPPARPQLTRQQTAGLIIAAVGLAFALVNLGNVKVDWIVGSAHSPLILVIVVSVLIGVGIDRVALRRARKRSKPPDA